MICYIYVSVRLLSFGNVAATSFAIGPKVFPRKFIADLMHFLGGPAFLLVSIYFSLEAKAKAQTSENSRPPKSVRPPKPPTAKAHRVARAIPGQVLAFQDKTQAQHGGTEQFFFETGTKRRHQQPINNNSRAGWAAHLSCKKTQMGASKRHGGVLSLPLF